MKPIHELNKEREAKQTELFNRCGVFFAFSTEQFNEGKTPLKEGDKYVSMGMGGYLPKSEIDNFSSGMKELSKWFKQAIKDNKARRSLIAYELANHEAYYTGDIEDTLNVLGSDYSREEVLKVYNEEKENYD